MTIKRQHVKSKLAVAYKLIHTPEIAGHIPDTDLLRESSFKKMISKHSKVYLKPDGGRKSRGVLRIERLSEDRFMIRIESDIQYVDAKELWRKVQYMTRDRKYLIQQSIDSVTKDGRHFDLRCHVVRINGEWELGGICGRLGKRGSVVTTSHAGGTPTLLETLFTRHLDYSRSERADMTQRLEKVAVSAAWYVSQLYPNLKEFAVDIGVDARKRIWIYEVNMEPLTRGNFMLLPDKTLYRRIQFMRKRARL
jgi:glutathione synthase/RimK-type ligase-like ATP-grasp enzyme